VALWGLGKGFPTRGMSLGGRYGYEDQAETPNTQVCNYAYDDGTMLVFEVRGRAANDEGGIKVGNIFYGSEGYMVDKTLFDKDGNEIPDDDRAIPPDLAGLSDEDSTAHFSNFLKAIHSRKQADVHGTALDGHLASGYCHLANISYRLGREFHFDPEKERFIGEHADRGNAMLKRDYRKEFEVPQLA